MFYDFVVKVGSITPVKALLHEVSMYDMSRSRVAAVIVHAKFLSVIVELET